MRVRCTHCGEYFPKEEMYRTSGMTKVCSAECLTAMHQHKPNYRRPVPKRSLNERRTDGQIPAAVRAAVYERDWHRCRYCSRQYDLHAHHILYRSQGGKHVEWNLITLCSDHHALVHSSKERYMPLLLGVLWAHYAMGKRYSVPQVERWFTKKS